MGDPSNPYVPFPIKYLPQPDRNPIDGFTPVDPKVVPCYEAVNVSDQ